MQGSSPWFTPTTSALQNQQTDNSNYFYNYNRQAWERSANGYQSDYYTGPGQYPMSSNMRTCNENQGFGAENGNYQCPPMYFRQDNVHGDGPPNPNVRPRHDRSQAGSQNGSIPNCGQPPSSTNKMRHPRCGTRPNDSEAENFSSVFTQSLTSLYSQDTEANFEDKNYKVDPDAPTGETEVNNCARQKAEDLPNGCSAEYSFNSVFSNDLANQHPPPGVNSFENLKMKSDFPPIESPLRYDSYSMDDTYLKRRRSLADAYNRKRKRSSVPSMSYRAPIDADSSDAKGSDMFNNQSHWIPNSIQSCHGNETSSNDTYQTAEFPSVNQSGNYDGFENTRVFKRQPTKYRGSRGRPPNNEARVQNAIKRIPKKISPLTVYAKIHEDRIIEVTCRRYKKRTKPANAEDSISGQNSHDGGFNRNSETMERLCQSVHKVVQNMVERVSVISMPKRAIDLSLINPAKAKELLSKLCSDYSLDKRDFQDFNEILSTNMASENKDTVERQQTPQRRTSEREFSARKNDYVDEKEDVIETKSERHSNKESGHNNTERCIDKSNDNQKPQKSERKVGRPRKQHVVNENEKRVLRSLPSRQPGNKSGKKAKKIGRQIKNRYPKRKAARGGRGSRGKKLKILIDLSKDNSNTEEVLELDSDSSRVTSNPGVDKDEDEEENGIVENDDDIKEVDKRNLEPEEPHPTSHESPQPPIPPDVDEEPLIQEITPIADDKVKQEPDVSASDDEYQIVSEVPQASPPMVETADETLQNIKQEIDEEDTMLRQPPQLVCMAPEAGDDDKLFLEASQQKDNNCSDRRSSDRRLPPMYLRANGLEERDAPSPPKLKRTTTSTKYNRSYSGESNSCDFMTIDSDDPDGKLVIDMEAPENPPEKQDEQSTAKAEMNNVADNSQELQSSMKPEESSTISKDEDNFKDDDCVVIPSKETETKASIEIIDLVMKQKPTKHDKHSLLKKKLLEKPILKKVEDELVEIKKSAMMSSMEKCQSKAEQDESILRTLLLESEVMAGNSSAEAANLAMSRVLGLAGQESASNLDFLKNTDTKVSQVNTFPTDPPLGLSEAMKLLKYQSYHDAYANSSSPDTFDETQKQFKDGTPLPQPDYKDPLTKDSQQLVEKIKKLKNEILYLQGMAEQKEKERVAIVCFKKYKEEILRRIYKAYTFSVPGHVREWLVSRRENSGENRSSSESASHSHKNHKSDSSRISESGRPEGSKDVSSYPVPAPAHAASNHCPQSIHSPQLLPKNHRNPPASGEKVSTIETMVAKATENYGLDMRNLREGLRTSPEESAMSGNILQKVLSSNSSRNSSPDQHRSWSPEGMYKKNCGAPKLVQPVISKPYTEPYGPLDMMIPQKSSSHKNSDVYRNSPESSRSGKPFHGSERSQIQSVLSEPVQLKANRNPYRSWSIQAGGRISEDRTKQSKHMSSVLRQSPNIIPQTNVAPVESPLQRQLNSHKAIPRPNFAIPSSLEPSAYSQHSTSLHQRSERSSLSGERMHLEKKPDEDRRHHPYGPNPLSSNSTMPYGGHIIRNNNTSPLATALSSNKPNISAAQGNNSGSSTGSSSSAGSTPLCMGCGVSDAKFLCSGCRKHWYCSAQCQTLRWPEHSRTCAGRMFSQSASSYS